MELKFRKLEKGWKWYLFEKKICVANSSNAHWSSKNGAKRGFERFKNNLDTIVMGTFQYRIIPKKNLNRV